MTFNYKKNKIEQLKGFCAVVECGSSVHDAAVKSNISATTISKQISSLEEDLGFLLFNRVKNRLVLNKEGMLYYKEAKRVLLDLDKIYNGKIGVEEVSKVQILFKRIQIKIVDYKNNMIKKLKMIIIKITLLRFLTFVSLFCAGVFVYLHQTNWFFDRKIERLANPLLREVMRVGYYRIDKNIPCKDNVSATIFCMNINELLLDLIRGGYNNINVSMIKVTKLVSTPMRMTFNRKENEIFNNDKEITCDRERRFEWLNERHDNKMRLINENKNARFYLFYENVGGTNYSQMLEKVKKYPEQIFHFHINNSKFYLNHGTYWIIKYNNYYYMMYETNGVSSHHQHEMGERYLIFKKLTLDQLMHYDNGSYWKLIKEYNIQID